MRTLLGKLKKGEVLLGVNSMFPAPGIIERIGPDWDFVWIDAQHGQHDYASILASVRAADLVGTESLVRVPGHDHGFIGRVLDTGASGVLVPQVETAEEAKAIVRAAKFAPLGYRSYGGRRPIDLYQRGYAHTANDEVALVVQIESPSAAARADEIFSVEGVDAFFFGPDDMALSEGLPMDKPRPHTKYDILLKELAETARRHGVSPGGSFGNLESLEKVAGMGYQLIAVGSDVNFLATTSRKHRNDMQAVLDGLGGSVKKGVDSPY